MQNTYAMPILELNDISQSTLDALQNLADISEKTIQESVLTLINQGLQNKLDQEIYMKRKKQALENIKNLRPHFAHISLEETLLMIREDRER
jgi:hypothetical protein